MRRGEKLFEDLTDLSYKRNTVGAIAFFILYLLFLFIGASTLGLIVAMGSMSVESAEIIGTLLAALYIFFLAQSILKQKNLQKEYRYYWLLVLAELLTLAAGGLWGLIPLAYLTTRASKEKNKITSTTKKQAIRKKI